MGACELRSLCFFSGQKRREEIAIRNDHLEHTYKAQSFCVKKRNNGQGDNTRRYSSVAMIVLAAAAAAKGVGHCKKGAAQLACNKQSGSEANIETSCKQPTQHDSTRLDSTL